jgi:hypothetical protein
VTRSLYWSESFDQLLTRPLNLCVGSFDLGVFLQSLRIQDLEVVECKAQKFLKAIKAKASTRSSYCFGFYWVWILDDLPCSNETFKQSTLSSPHCLGEIHRMWNLHLTISPCAFFCEYLASEFYWLGIDHCRSEIQIGSFGLFFKPQIQFWSEIASWDFTKATVLWIEIKVYS